MFLYITNIVTKHLSRTKLSLQESGLQKEQAVNSIKISSNLKMDFLQGLTWSRYSCDSTMMASKYSFWNPGSFWPLDCTKIKKESLKQATCSWLTPVVAEGTWMTLACQEENVCFDSQHRTVLVNCNFQKEVAIFMHL